MNTKFFGESNKNKFIKELKKVLGDIGGGKIKDFTEGHFTKVDASGNLVDAGMAITELTQAEYDALTEKDVNTIYIIKYLIDDPFNGHDYIDLGLVDNDGNKLLFATNNIGAQSPETAGGYYAFGEITEKSTYSRTNYKYFENNIYTKYKIGEKEVLDLEDDVANIEFGGDWHIPTPDEFSLLLQCKYEHDQNNYGIFTGLNGNTMILPLAGIKSGSNISQPNDGFYATSSLSPLSTQYLNSYFHTLHIYDEASIGSDARHLGVNIRPVIKVKSLFDAYKLYKGSILIADSNLPNEIEQLLASI